MYRISLQTMVCKYDDTLTTPLSLMTKKRTKYSKIYKFSKGVISELRVERLPATEFTSPHEIIKFIDSYKQDAGDLFMNVGSAAKLAKALAFSDE